MFNYCERNGDITVMRLRESAYPLNDQEVFTYGFANEKQPFMVYVIGKNISFLTN